MDEKEVKKRLIAASVSVEIAIENLKAVLGTKNLFLSELILQCIPVLVEQERKLSMLRGLMEAEESKLG